jgi:hypothetical protein
MSEKNWIRIAKEIRDLPGGLAALRVLQAHGLTHIISFADNGYIAKSHSIDGIIDTAHREPS